MPKWRGNAKWMWTGVAVVVAGSSLGVWGWQKHQSAIGGRGAAATSTSFPPVIQQALTHFNPVLYDQLEAPTVLPQSKQGAGALTFHTMATGTGTVKNYNVTLQQGGRSIAEFSGAQYASAAAAKSGIQMSSYNAQTAKQTTMQLATGVKATAAVSGGAGQSSNDVAWIHWRHGGWTFQVAATDTTKLPIKSADALAGYVQRHALPTLHGGGMVYVRFTAGSQGARTGIAKAAQQDTYVVWQENQNVYEVDTYTACQNGVQTALAMARSMTT